MNIYIGNISLDTTKDQLRQTFAAFGEVTSVKIITDKESGRPKGFAFVEMSVNDEAIAAISGLNGKNMNGRTLKINEANQKNSGNREGGNHYRKMY